MGKKSKKITLSNSTFILSLFVSMLITVIVTLLVASSSLAFLNTSTPNATGLPDRLYHGLVDSYMRIKATYMGDIDEDKLIDGALSGFVSGIGDPYTSYLNEDDWKSLEEATDSSFEGIGVEVEQSGEFIRVVSPYDNAPASKGGLQTGDYIIGVDGIDIIGQTTAEVVTKIRGKKGTPVTLKIRRGPSDFEVTLIRDTIPLTSVKFSIDGDIGIIRLSSFSSTTYSELVDALLSLREQGVTKFIIDVRNNPGGLLDSVENISSLFVPQNTVIYKMEDRQTGVKEVMSLINGTPVKEPVVVLINKGSASASEIFAAALSENNRAKLVGETSFGKGTAQTILPLTANTGLKITFSKWLTPSGKWIHKDGIVPDYEVSLPAFSQYVLLNTMTVLEVGQESEAILNAQKILQVVGIPIQLTGKFDDSMVDAVKSFQKQHGLSETGIIDSQTSGKLNHLLIEKIKTDDPQLEKAKELLK